jgi:Ca2+-binding EF-hand superfamily protein
MEITMWEKIKKWFGLLDLNKDGKVTAEDLEVARTLTEKTVKEANEKINTVNDQITDAVTQVKQRTARVKEEVADVIVAAKEVIDQAEDVVVAVKGKARKGRKKK